MSYQAKSYTFRWNASADATGYELYEDPDGAGPQRAGQVMGAPGATSSTLQHDVLLGERVAAQYRVRACNAGGCSAFSDAVVPEVDRAIGYFKASNTGGGDRLGASVALSADGSVMVVGAPGEASANASEADDSAPNAGAAYVFVRTAAGWTQQARLKASTPAASAYFGWRVALSDDGRTLVVGAPYEGGAGLGQGPGATYVFTSDGAAWTLRKRLALALVDGQFGAAVAISRDGGTIAVSAPGDNVGGSGVSPAVPAMLPPGPASGAVHVFAGSGDTWAQQAYIKGLTPASFDAFGTSLALSGDGGTLAVGARGVGSTGPDAESAFVYVRSGAAWSLQQQLQAVAPNANDDFGASVGLSADGSTLAVGAYMDSSSGAWTGAAHVFRRSGAAWTREAKLLPANAQMMEFFGLALSVSADGALVAVGAPGERGTGLGLHSDPALQADPYLGADSGAVYLFRRTGTAWAQGSYVKASSDTRAFGRGVALSATGQHLAVGAWGDRSNGTGIGANAADTSLFEAGAVFLY